jgi:two-component system NarL family response regulator
MAVSPQLGVAELLESRYLGLVELARMVAAAQDWKQLVEAISAGLERANAEPLLEPPPVRIWAITAEGFGELARYPADHEFPHCPPRELKRAARQSEPVEPSHGGVLVGLQAGGVILGVAEVEDQAADRDLLTHAAPIIASRVSLLAGHGIGGVLLAPLAVETASDAASLMAAFAAEAKRQLSHDRLSAYLLTCEGRAFERFAVATSPIIPGEGVVIPFEDLGLRHVVITNRALVSPDLATDARVVGREDRVIASAGFHGLLSVPLRLHGRPIGVLNFVSRTSAFYSDEDIPSAQQIADQIAAFVGNLHVQQRMRTLIRHEATERERTRIGRDLYHAVAQSMPAIARVGEELTERLAESDPEACAQAARVRELANRTLVDVRRAVANLVPRDLDSHTLEEAVRSALQMLADDGPTPHLDVRGDTVAVSGAVRRGVYRIVQEALTNVRVHAAAANVTVTIDCGRDLLVTIDDDGIGYDADLAAASAGLGLQHMLDRARALGGLLTIENRPRGGTRVRLELLGIGDAGDEPMRPTPEVGAAPGANLRVFIVERHPLTRAGLLHLIGAAADLRVVGEAASIDEARGQLRRLWPDVVLLDAHLPGPELERLVRALRAELPLAGLVIMSESATGHEAALAEAGASAYLRKEISAGELADAVRAVAGGAKTRPPELPTALEGGNLSSRERLILCLMVAGCTNTEIGKRLFLATKTVERQVATVVRKLGARNRAHAAAIAVSRHIVDPEAAG